jgi:hypothetical protein
VILRVLLLVYLSLSLLLLPRQGESLCLRSVAFSLVVIIIIIIVVVEWFDRVLSRLLY